MPQNACERGFCHVMAFSQFFEIPQNRRLSFQMPHFSYLILKMGKMGHFKKFEHEKLGHFKKIARDQF